MYGSELGLELEGVMGLLFGDFYEGFGMLAIMSTIVPRVLVHGDWEGELTEFGHVLLKIWVLICKL
jgi:hypothetical protein